MALRFTVWRARTACSKSDSGRPMSGFADTPALSPRARIGVLMAIVAIHALLGIALVRAFGGVRALADQVGPVLVAIPWRDEAEVIGLANSSHYGLAAYVWTHEIGTALRCAHAIEAGWVQVNQGGGQLPGHSYGGVKQSGIGREFSLAGMLDSLTQTKNVTVSLTTPPRR